jgi:hypothetical protein
MRVGDHQLDADEAAALEALEKSDQKTSASEGPMCRPTISRRPSVLTATVIIAATETMRPAALTLR